ncbi:uncharacterized protein EV420DRAFT_1480270 [Desarmillaria tabescens]|uniref:Uncharacterized protein n=1 Tax=Armillaria tabescens TaxID=1929756 RepID=A0AA39N5L3_ARMTA|nr:uncharacterized protein EV420DRAFT_1480270 [Desarmillaria tabescens]KAK0458120.1 hypothetical protein EV420DRAFT_1480270 [Desarmillaria tabescens]
MYGDRQDSQVQHSQLMKGKNSSGGRKLVEKSGESKGIQRNSTPRNRDGLFLLDPDFRSEFDDEDQGGDLRDPAPPVPAKVWFSNVGTFYIKTGRCSSSRRPHVFSSGEREEEDRDREEMRRCSVLYGTEEVLKAMTAKHLRPMPTSPRRTGQKKTDVDVGRPRSTGWRAYFLDSSHRERPKDGGWDGKLPLGDRTTLRTNWGTMGVDEEEGKDWEFRRHESDKEGEDCDAAISEDRERRGPHCWRIFEIPQIKGQQSRLHDSSQIQSPLPAKASSVHTILGSESNLRDCENPLGGALRLPELLRKRDVMTWCTKLMRSDADGVWLEDRQTKAHSSTVPKPNCVQSKLYLIAFGTDQLSIAHRPVLERSILLCLQS